VKRSGDDGFLVNEKDNRSLLKGNVAIGAADDGFDVRSPQRKADRESGVAEPRPSASRPAAG
jgi:hypothetical protein